MHVAALPAEATPLPENDALALAAALLTQEGLGGASRALSLLSQHAGLAGYEQAQLVLIETAALLIDAFAQGDVAGAVDALNGCDMRIAASMRDLLLGAFAADGALQLAALDDAAVLCLVLLTARAGAHDGALSLLKDVRQQRPARHFLAMADLLQGLIATHEQPSFKPKLIIWDLDDTLWTGTLAEGDAVEPIAQRVALLRAYNQHGIVSAICSKNDPEVARAKLEELGLWDAFVFPRIAFVPKGAAVKRLIADMQLRPENTLFVDDNPHNLHEVQAAVPGIHVVDATTPECDRLLGQILKDNSHVTKSRVEDYRLLQAKIDEQVQSGLSNEDFLAQSDLNVVVTRWLDNLEFVERIEELINRSNQLNYTETRIAPGTLAPLMMEIFRYDTRCVFAWDKYGDYGLIGFAMVEFETKRLIHFAFSCRIMHMGIENFVLGKLIERHKYVELDNLPKPLPLQDGRFIKDVSFASEGVRERILAREAPRDQGRIDLRIMCDCQSGAFHHYSRFQREMEFDNNPRLFSLPMMLNGKYEKEKFPRHLVYTPATDYLAWRWTIQEMELDDTLYCDALDRFRNLILEGDHRLLIFLPPVDAADSKYVPAIRRSRSFEREQGRAFNMLWLALAKLHPEHIQCIMLDDVIRDDEMSDSNHYQPPFLRKMAGMIDDWYALQRVPVKRLRSA